MVTRNQMLRNRYIVQGELRRDLIQEKGACENCGYSEFLEILEVAHIIHGHEIEKLRRDNVFLLCPNCHKSFDRGLLEINGEVSDCHLVQYRSPLVLVKATKKVRDLKKIKPYGWKRIADGKFVRV